MILALTCFMILASYQINQWLDWSLMVVCLNKHVCLIRLQFTRMVKKKNKQSQYHLLYVLLLFE